MEPGDLWLRYLPAKLKDHAPRPMSPDPTDFHMLIEGVEFPRLAFFKDFKKKVSNEAYKKKLSVVRSTDFSSKSQLDGMDKEGITAAVLFPTRGLFVMGVKDGVDPRLTTAWSEAYNNWLNDFCSADRSRLIGAAMIDPRDVDGASKEARRCVKELGFAAIFLRPNPVSGKAWYDLSYDPLWSELEDLDVPVCFHEGAAVDLPQVGLDRFPDHAFWHACTHPMGQQMAMLAMLMGGVAERHPKLRMAFLECGAGWLPYWLWRLDEHVENENTISST